MAHCVDQVTGFAVTLIGSFLTAYPDQTRRAIDAYPSLELMSIEEVTPEMFIRYEASPSIRYTS